MRFMLYSHDGAGLGHARRNLAIAASLAHLSSGGILVVTGSDHVYRLGIPAGVEVLKLPGLRKESNGHYAARYLRVDAKHIRRLRASLLLATVQSFRPHVMLVDKHPLGASGELAEALALLKRAGGRAVLGLRDILDDPAAVRHEWHAHGLPELIDAYYDRILVYGSPRVLDPLEEYDLPAGLADRTRFCDYVVNRSLIRVRASDAPPPLLNEPRNRPVVLACAGGGEDGSLMLAAFIAAAVEAEWQGIVITGPLAAPSDHSSLTRLAESAGVTLYTYVGGLPQWFEKADALVCMGGYNTLAEAISTGTPAVCVPRTSPRSEQLIRARAFARMGLLRVLELDRLNAEALQEEIAIALASSRQAIAATAHSLFDFRGADRAAECLVELAQEAEPAGEPQPAAIGS